MNDFRFGCGFRDGLVYQSIESPGAGVRPGVNMATPDARFSMSSSKNCKFAKGRIKSGIEEGLNWIKFNETRVTRKGFF